MENGDPGPSSRFTSATEIEEEERAYVWGLFDIRSRIPPTIPEEFEDSLDSSDSESGDYEYFVPICNKDSSMGALLWTLKHAVNRPSAVVNLIHVFPEVRHIPTPLGNMLKSQVNEEQVEKYMIYEESKRRQLLQKYLVKCSAAGVKAETHLIESDGVAKALLDLIPIYNIRKLVLGITKSNLRKLKRGSGMVYQVLKNAPSFCDVKIICEGKEVNIQTLGSSSPATDDITGGDSSVGRASD